MRCNYTPTVSWCLRKAFATCEIRWPSTNALNLHNHNSRDMLTSHSSSKEMFVWNCSAASTALFISTLEVKQNKIVEDEGTAVWTFWSVPAEKTLNCSLQVSVRVQFLQNKKTKNHSCKSIKYYNSLIPHTKPNVIWYWHYSNNSLHFEQFHNHLKKTCILKCWIWLIFQSSG